MKRFEQVFNLKGSREYVHGTDIFDQVVNDLSDEANRVSHFEMTFSGRIQNTACTWHYANHESELDTRSAACRGKYRLDGAEHFFTLTPNIEQGTRTRIVYDEDDVTGQAQLTDAASTMTVNKKYSFIENLVALNKLYHVHYHKLESKQWMFAKISLRELPRLVSEIEIHDETMILDRLSKRRIIVDGEQVGFIFFSAG